MSDPLSFSLTFKVRPYELDSLGHVNNAVYLNYAEHIATEHVEALGIGKAWSEAQGGTWVVRRHEITYHQGAVFGDELVLVTRPEGFKAATGYRRTKITRGRDGVLLAEVFTEWVWLKLPEGRPARIPAAIVERLSDPAATARS